MSGEDNAQRIESDSNQSGPEVPGVESQIILPRNVLVKMYKLLLVDMLSPIVNLLTSFLLLSGAANFATPRYSRLVNSLLSFLTFLSNWIKTQMSEKTFLFLTLEGYDLVRAVIGYSLNYAEFTGNKLFNMYLRFKDLVQYHLYALSNLKIIIFHSQVTLLAVSVYSFLTLPLLSLYDTILRKHFRCVRYIRRSIERHFDGSPSGLTHIREHVESEEQETSPFKPPTESRPKRKREQPIVTADVLPPASSEHNMAQESPQLSTGPRDSANSPRMDVQPPTDEAND